jgi:hypothetical protein
MDSLGATMGHRSEDRRLRAALLAVAATLAFTSCGGDPSGATGPTAGRPTAPDGTSGSSPSATAASETPSPEPTDSGAGEPGGELIRVIDLCEELDLATLSEVTGLRLAPGVFDGAVCAWVDRDERGTLTMSLGKPEGSTATYIEETLALDIAEEVTVAGADAAVAVTISTGSGANRSTRVGLVAEVGPDQLTVVLTTRDASVATVVALAGLATGA